MNLFQIVGLFVLGMLVLASLRSYRCGRMRVPGLLFWLTVSTAGALALVFPDSTTVVAQVIGVERGADLLLYSSILAGLLVSFLGYLRFRILDRQITQLVRQHALENPCIPRDDPGVNPASAETTRNVQP